MTTTKTKSNSASNGSTGKAKSSSSRTHKSSSENGLQSSQLMKLFEDELKDIFWAEKALTKAIPKMIKYATSKELNDALKSHLKETNQQVERLEKVFASIDKKPVSKKCEAMEGLIKEAGEIMEECEEGPMCDAGIISAAQKVEHYEIATYGTLCQFAKTLGLEKAHKLLTATLEEEKAADRKLSEAATATINLEAAEMEA